MNCPECEQPLAVGEIEVYNDLAYHPYCAALQRVESTRIIAEKMRKEKLLDENPWLWEFKQEYDKWVENTFNKSVDSPEHKYY